MSRFHLLSEFDEGKRSCRRRLLGHNKRRRKKEERAREPEEAPGLRSPPAASGASPLEYDAQEDIRRRLTASLLPDPPDLERAPSLQLGQSLSLSPYSQQSPAVRGPSQDEQIRMRLGSLRQSGELAIHACPLKPSAP